MLFRSAENPYPQVLEHKASTNAIPPPNGLFEIKWAKSRSIVSLFSIQ